jgi:hypothetical protein
MFWLLNVETNILMHWFYKVTYIVDWNNISTKTW